MQTATQDQTFYLSTWGESRSNRARRRRWTVEAASLEDAMFVSRMAHMNAIRHANTGVYVDVIAEPTAADIARPPIRERRIVMVDGVECYR